MTPQDNQTIYNLNPLYTAGYSGQGQTIALVEDTDTYSGTGDWNTYRSTFGLAAAFPLGTYTQVHPGCTDPGTNADDGEAAIDVEVATGDRAQRRHRTDLVPVGHDHLRRPDRHAEPD